MTVCGLNLLSCQQSLHVIGTVQISRQTSSRFNTKTPRFVTGKCTPSLVLLFREHRPVGIYRTYPSTGPHLIFLPFIRSSHHEVLQIADLCCSDMSVNVRMPIRTERLQLMQYPPFIFSVSS